MGARKWQANFGGPVLRAHRRQEGEEAFRAALLMIDTPAPSCYIRNMKWTESETALLAELLLQLGAQGRAVAAIDGNAAAGKSTLAARIAAFFAPRCSVNVFHMDDFFLPGALRTPERLAEPGGNVHYERFQDEVLAGCRLGRAVFLWRVRLRQDGRDAPRRGRTRRTHARGGRLQHAPLFRHAL